jgi:3-dehydroquinate synthase
VDSVVDATRLDKKARAGRVEYALPSRIGAMAGEESGWALPVDDQLVHEVLA